MSTAMDIDVDPARLSDHVVIIGAGFQGLACALEAQARNPMRQVDIVAQVFLTDPPPAAWTSGLSRCYFSCLKNSYANFEEKTLEYVLKLSEHCMHFNQFKFTEYFATNVPKNRIISHRDLTELADAELIDGAKQGFQFQSTAVVPQAFGFYLQQLFLRRGGRMFRGTVRHLDEIVHGGVASFQRLKDGTVPADGAIPSAIVVCLGMGARFLGGVEDKTLRALQVPVLKLRLPTVTTGRAFYDNLEGAPTFFIVPLGDGIVAIGGPPQQDVWVAKPAKASRDALLQQAVRFCPDIIPQDASAHVIWEGLDSFAVRNDGPCIDLRLVQPQPGLSKVPILLNYGHGISEFQTHHEVATNVINLMEGALEQAREAARVDKDIQDLIRQATATNNTQNL